MPPTDDAYTLTDLADLADVTPRTVRYYIAQGLLPTPSQLGPGARYGDRHLDRIRLIKLLQREHLPLAEIRARLEKLDDRQVAHMARSAPSTTKPIGSAADYIRSVLRAPMAIESPRMTADSLAIGRQVREPEVAPSAPALAPSSTPGRSQWDRISLSPDVELHVRRPLTRHHNRLVDRLIAIARQLFEEEPK